MAAAQADAEQNGPRPQNGLKHPHPREINRYVTSITVQPFTFFFFFEFIHWKNNNEEPFFYQTALNDGNIGNVFIQVIPQNKDHAMVQSTEEVTLFLRILLRMPRIFIRCLEFYI